ncbi:unnamed protein product [Amaranthus hypochondriacus]
MIDEMRDAFEKKMLISTSEYLQGMMFSVTDYALPGQEWQIVYQSAQNRGGFKKDWRRYVKARNLVVGSYLAFLYDFDEVQAKFDSKLPDELGLLLLQPTELCRQLYHLVRISGFVFVLQLRSGLISYSFF